MLRSQRLRLVNRQGDAGPQLLDPAKMLRLALLIGSPFEAHGLEVGLQGAICFGFREQGFVFIIFQNPFTDQFGRQA